MSFSTLPLPCELYSGAHHMPLVLALVVHTPQNSSGIPAAPSATD